MIAEELTALGAGQLLSNLLPASTVGGPARATKILGPTQSDQLVALCRNNRLAPILGDFVQSGQLDLAEPSQDELARSIEHYLASQLRVECGAMAVIDVLDEKGIDFRVIKGMATGYLDYPNPAMRPFGDLDILVRPVDMPRVIDALAEMPGGAFHVLPRNDWRVTHALPFRINSIEIDVHHRLLHQAAGHCAAQLDLFADSQIYEIAGRSVSALPPRLRLILAASQNVLGGYQQLSSDLDVARLSNHLEPALEEAARVGLAWVVSEGVRRSQRNLGWGHSVETTTEPLWRDRGFERTYGREASSTMEKAVFEVLIAPPSIAVALVAGAVAPGDGYLKRRGRTPGQQLRRQLKRFRAKRQG